jgi:hypothetical protein
VTCVIDISVLQSGQISIDGTTGHAKLALMTLPFPRQNVGAYKRLTLDWVPVSLKSWSWNWLGRFATAARSPRLLCAYYPQESRKKLRQSDGRLAEASLSSKVTGPNPLRRVMKASGFSLQSADRPQINRSQNKSDE